MTTASERDLRAYLANVVEHLERYAVTVLAPNDRDTIALGTEADGSLVLDLEGRLPVARRSRDVKLELFERWSPIERGRWACVEYGYELRHEELGYRRALHRHDEARFVRHLGVATHEHCETTMGVVTCDHYFGVPVRDAIDGFERLYGLWLTGAKPDCRALRCLE